MCNDFNLPFTLLANLNRVAQIAPAIIDFDLVVQELLKGHPERKEVYILRSFGCDVDVLGERGEILPLLSVRSLRIYASSHPCSPIC